MKIVHFRDLSNNNLNGSIPDMNLSDNITTIDLSRNQLTGTIPPNFSGLPNLQRLSLFNNSLNGTVPSGIWQNRTLNATDQLILYVLEVKIYPLLSLILSLSLYIYIHTYVRVHQFLCTPTYTYMCPPCLCMCVSWAANEPNEHEQDLVCVRLLRNICVHELFMNTYRTRFYVRIVCVKEMNVFVFVC
ncbi:putative non-specific serine/threonine protein kinase [Helianthus annuus]|nr:putative non-specific serine/threonine protein kinase [Helianthus annuus]